MTKHVSTSATAEPECRWTYEFDDGRPTEGGILSQAQAVAWARDAFVKWSAPQPTIEDAANIQDIRIREYVEGIRSVKFVIKDAGDGFEAWADARAEHSQREATA
jgi:hypothetical protein